MVKAIIFDLDGTLINSHKAHIKSYQLVLDKMNLKIKYSGLKEHFGKIAEDILSSVMPELSMSEIKKIILKKRKAFIKLINMILLEPCAERILKKASRDYVIALATSSSRIEMNALLDKFSWKNYFKITITSYDVLKPKPAPDILLKTARLLKLSVSDCIFIGDSIFDAQAARSAGMPFLGVETGSFSKNDFKKKGFKSYNNLCALMHSFF